MGLIWRRAHQRQAHQVRVDKQVLFVLVDTCRWGAGGLHVVAQAFDHDKDDSQCLWQACEGCFGFGFGCGCGCGGRKG